MERAGHLAVALQFADVADIDQHDVVAAVQLDRVLDRERFDLALGRLDQRFLLLRVMFWAIGCFRFIRWWQSQRLGQAAVGEIFRKASAVLETAPRSGR